MSSATRSATSRPPTSTGGGGSGRVVHTVDKRASHRSSTSTTRQRDERHREGRGPRSDIERAVLGEPAEASIRAGGAAGHTMLPKEVAVIVDEPLPFHEPTDLARPCSGRTRFARFRDVDVRSILAIGPATRPKPAAANDNVIVELLN